MPAIKVPTIGDWNSLGILFALLPGLLTYLIHHALVCRNQKIEAVHAVLWALAYTLLVHAIWVLAKLPGSWIPTPDIVGLSLSAVALGLALSFCSAQGWIYKWLRKMRFTRESSWATVWNTAFHECRYDQKMDYAVLHLKDGKRAYGGICGFSTDQQNGHVALSPFQWLTKNVEDELPMSQNTLLVEAGLIAFVEFTSTNIVQKDQSHV